MSDETQTPVVDTPAVEGSTPLSTKTPSAKSCKRSYNSFHTFINRLIKTEEGEHCITQEAKDLTNNLIVLISNKFIKYAIDLLYTTDKKTISADVFRCVASLEYGRNDPCVKFADTVLNTFKTSKVSGNNIKKAGLILPPARFKTLIEQYRPARYNIGGNAHIYLTALVEYVTREIIKSSLEVTVSESKRTISDFHFQMALGSRNLSTYMSAVGSLYIVPNGLYSNQNERSDFQNALYKRIKKAQRKTRARKAKADASSHETVKA